MKLTGKKKKGKTDTVSKNIETLTNNVHAVSRSIEDLAQMIERNVAKKEEINEIKIILTTLATKKDIEAIEQRHENRLDDTDLDIASHDERISILERKSARL